MTLEPDTASGHVSDELTTLPLEPATSGAEESNQTSRSLAPSSSVTNRNDSSTGSTSQPAEETSTKGDSCAGQAYLLCESFEKTELGDIPNGWARRGDGANVSDESARGGSKALKLNRSILEERSIVHDAGLLGSSHWARIFYRVELPVPDASVHSTLVSLTGVGLNGPSEYRVVDTMKQAADTPDVGSRHNWQYNVQPENASEWTHDTNADWQFDGQWHCVEYFVSFEGHAFRLFFDGVEVMSFSDAQPDFGRSDVPETFDELRVGWKSYQDAPPGFVAYIDDIAFDSERIGCE